ncbi:MAG TPA: helix-turn-helix transcriptional regulator [Streptosporangiaceae bacterium]|nr:helix-turn-helix transcriptional regulator [Streptosporangiaceae bacterium]
MRASSAGLVTLQAAGSHAERGFQGGVLRQLAAGLPDLDATAEPTGVLAGVDPSRLVVAIDDVECADRESLAWLNRMAAAQPCPYMIFAGASRAGAASQTAGPTPVGPSRPALATPPRLLGPALATLLTRRFGVVPQSSLVAACAAVTGGNALVTTWLLDRLAATAAVPTAEAVHGLVRSPWPELEADLASRLRRHHPHALAVATATALLGSDCQPGQLARVTSLPEHSLTTLADSLVTAGVLARHARSGHYRVKIPAIRAALTRMASGDHRLRALTEHRVTYADAGRAAAHLFSLPPLGEPWTADLLLAAAKQAEARGAPSVAARYMRRLTSEPARITGLRSTSALPLQVTAVPGSWPEAGDSSGTLPLVTLGAVTGSTRHSLPHWVSAALRAPSRPEEGDRAHRAAAHAIRMAMSGADASAAATAARQALAALTGGDTALFAAALAVHVLGCAGELEEALRHCRSLGHEAADSGWETASVLRLERARLRLGTGALALACRDAHAALAAADREGAAADHDIRTAALAVLVSALTEEGRCQRAEALLHSARLASMTAERPAGLALMVAEGYLHLESGRYSEALAVLRECGRRSAQWGDPGGRLVPWQAGAALAEYGLGDRTAAQRLAEAGLEAARSWGSPVALGVALRVSGTVAPGDSGLESLAEAVRMLRPTGARLELAKALLASGHSMRKSRRRRDARAQLAEALAITSDCGAWALTKKTVGELRLAAGTPTKTPLDLTVAESQVAELAATGMTNAAIARSLGVALRTVETHLTHVYRKLGLHARDELAAALAASAPLAGPRWDARAAS